MQQRTSSCIRAWLIGVAILVCVMPAFGRPADVPFEINYQNDGIMWMDHKTTYSYPRWQELSGHKVERFRRDVDKYADCGVPSFSFGNWSVGNSFNRPTKVGRPFAQGISDEVMTLAGHLRHKKRLADYLGRGIDPLGEVISRTHERGMKITVEFRMNNAAPSGPLESPSKAGPGYNGLLWYQKPEWRLTDAYPSPAKPDLPGEENPNWDYAKPEVRDYYLRVVEEVIDNYDIDGIDLSFSQNPPYFNLSEPNKAQHMTDFVQKVRDACDRAGKERGKRIMLTVVIYAEFNRRLHLRDDGMDVANWAKAGLIDRLIVMTHQIPWKSMMATWDIKPFIKMVEGTGCKLYAGCERREHTVYKQIEDMYRAMGLDGIFYFNYEVIPNSVMEEYRSQNVSYYGHVEPDKSPNAWQQDGVGGTLTSVQDKLELQGPIHLRRAAAMLSWGGTGLTMEATYQVSSAPGQGLCGFQVADGHRSATLGIRGDRMLLYEGTNQLAEIEIDATALNTVRLTLDSSHQINVYLNDDPQPAVTVMLGQATEAEHITWGHLEVSAHSNARSQWTSVSYTLEGAFSPQQRKFGR